MSIRLVTTRGYGNGTFNGTISSVVTRGYTIGLVLRLGYIFTQAEIGYNKVISSDVRYVRNLEAVIK
jgi:hypothetical protein